MAKDPIKKADNGTYYFRANLGYDSKGKKIQKYRGGFRTKKEAREEYHQILSQKPENIAEQKEEMTFEKYIEEIFTPWYKTTVRESTYEARLSIIGKHFSYFNAYGVSKIEPLHVQTWQLKLAETLSPSYVRGVQGLFSLAMDRAIALGLAEINPSKVIGNVKNQKPKIDFWTKEEFEKVISFIYKEDYYQHFLLTSLWLLFMTGMRIGEATAIQWDDIDFEKGILSITKTLYYKNQSDYSFHEPKTKASIRSIALDDDTLQRLKEWKKAQNKVTKTDFVMSYNGFPTQKHTISRAIERFSDMAGVHRITNHALRHGHASLLISMGENPLIIRDRLGHEDIETTLGTYGHLYPNSNLEVAQKLKGVLKYTPPLVNQDSPQKNRHTVNF